MTGTYKLIKEEAIKESHRANHITDDTVGIYAAVAAASSPQGVEVTA